MKITFFLYCLFTLSLSATVYSQSTKLSINVRNTSIKNVLHKIESETEFRFIYQTGKINMDKRISLNVNNMPVEDLLDRVFSSEKISYIITENNFILIDPYVSSSKPWPLVSQQGKRIIGTVTDTRGEAVIGANVVVKGTTNGVITDIDGKFALTVPENALLSISYIGYIPQEIAIGSQTSLSVMLIEDNQALEEVIVVGYGSQKKTNLAGAVESVTSKTLENRSTSNVALILQGLVPNLTITPSGGQADDSPSFNIRGTTSINGGSPLILIDGIPTEASDFSRMNSQDIDNISVLKDASSSAIYGARAAFGVILVTTKKGQGEKLTVRFNNNFNVRTLTRMPEVVLDPYIQASYKKEMGKPWYDLYTDEELEYALKRRDDPSLPGTIISSLNPNNYTYLDNTDWFGEIFDKTGTARSHNLNISGSNSKVSYYLGTEYYQEKGMLKINKDVMDRFNVRSRVEYKPTGWLTVGNNTALTYTTYNKPMNFYSWLFNRSMNINPLVPVRNPDGSYTSEGAEIVGTLEEGGKSASKKTSIYTQFTTDFELVKNVWNVKADFTAKLNNNKLNEWDSDRSIPYREGPNAPDRYFGWTNFAQSSSENTSYTIFNLYTDLHKTFDKHSLSAVGGYSQEYELYEFFYGRRLDLITDSYPTPQLATGEMTINEDKYAWVIRSAFYRLNYIFDGKYIFETNGRYDGTSRFPKDNRFGFFPSVSAAWIVSNERFFEPLSSLVSQTKIRGSYGSLGNQAVGNYPYIAMMDASKVNYLLNGEKPMGVYPPELVSSALTWEKVYTMNGGVDINFFKNRLAVTADIYRRDTKDMLTKGKTLPNVLGTSEPQINAADLKTTGWEVSVLWRDRFNLSKKPLDYSARFILADSRSFITKFDNPTGSLSDYYVGYEMGEMWGLETQGFFKDQQDIENSPSQWDVTSYPGDRPIEPGDLKYRDLNNDGKINYGNQTLDDPGDFKIIGNSSNRYTFGLDLNAGWNGFDIRVFMQGVGKRDFYPSGYKFSGVYTGPWGSVLTTNLDHWTPETPDALFPRLKSYLDWGVGDLSIIQTRYLQNAAYMRMKNLTVGYTLPGNLFSRVGLENVRVYFSGENLFELTKLHRNYDPEGLNSSGHPYQRTFSIGLNITL